MTILLILISLFSLNVSANVDEHYDPVGGEVVKRETTKLKDGSIYTMEKGIFLNCDLRDKGVCLKASFQKTQREIKLNPDGSIYYETGTIYSDVNPYLHVDVQSALKNNGEMRRFLRKKMKRYFPLSNEAFWLSAWVGYHSPIVLGIMTGLVIMPPAFAADLAFLTARSPVMFLSTTIKAQNMVKHMLEGTPGSKIQTKANLELMFDKMLKVNETELK